MYGARSEIHQHLRMSPCERSPLRRMPPVGAGRRVAVGERPCHSGLADVPAPSAVPDRLKFPVPALRGQPDFDLNVRIRTGRLASPPRDRRPGSVLKTFGPRPGPLGGVNPPASTVCASAMAVFGGCSEDRSAQTAASADCATKTRIGNLVTHIFSGHPEARLRTSIISPTAFIGSSRARRPGRRVSGAECH